MLKATLSVL